MEHARSVCGRSAPGAIARLRGLGLAAFLFFLIKGLAWLFVPALALHAFG